MLLASSLGVCGAQQANLAVRSSSEHPQPLVRAESDLVLINTTVLDKRGKIVTDIDAHQVQVFEDGVRQQIASFSLEETPASLVAVLDVSGSMKNSLPHAVAALQHLSTALKPGDEYKLITFRDEPEVRSPFTDAPRVLEDVLRHETAEGSTALVDALVIACREARSARNKRRAIILLSDGGERTSRHTWPELRSIVRETDASIYAFMLPGAMDDFDRFDLTRVVEDSGGRYDYLRNPRDFIAKLQDLEIHRQYVVGYTPKFKVRDGSFRRVKLRVSEDTRQLRVYWRRGYYAPRAP